MKKLIVITLLIIIGIVIADPGDLVITFTVPASKVADFRAGFLRVYPKPADVNGIPVYTDKQWLKKVVLTKFLFPAYERGKKRLALDAALQAVVVDPNVIE